MAAVRHHYHHDSRRSTARRGPIESATPSPGGEGPSLALPCDNESAGGYGAGATGHRATGAPPRNPDAITAQVSAEPVDASGQPVSLESPGGDWLRPTDGADGAGLPSFYGPDRITGEWLREPPRYFP